MFKQRPELWPQAQKRADEAAEKAKKARTTPWLVDDVRDVMESAGMRRAPQTARRREMRLLFSS